MAHSDDGDDDDDGDDIGDNGYFLGKEEYTDCVKTEVRVGKLSKDVFNPAPESPKEERPEVKVGGRCCSGVG